MRPMFSFLRKLLPLCGRNLKLIPTYFKKAVLKIFNTFKQSSALEQLFWDFKFVLATFVTLE